MRGSNAPKVWIDDNHSIFRRGLAACLHADGFDVIGESAGFAPPPRRYGLDVLVFEAEGPGLARAVDTAKVADGSMHLVALLRAPTEELVCDAVEAGVAAVLLRSELNPATLSGCLRSVVSGNATLPSGMLPRLLDRAANGDRHSGRGLRPREVDVLRLLAEGESTKDIADELCYSERTVKNVIHDVLVKMNCRNRAHAVALATRQGVI